MFRLNNLLRATQSTATKQYTTTTLLARTMSTSKFYSFTPTASNGEPFPFTQFEGKVVLIVNTASKCGFTKQFAELEELYKKYNEQGLEVIGFPCNQFASQDPDSDSQIVEFCKLHYGVTFPMMKKIDVNGDHQDPVYEYLKSEKSGLLGFKGIKWNFEKFLVDKTGKVVHRYSSVKNPASISGDIEKLLKQ